LSRILYIETGTNICSVAIAENEKIIGIKESSDEKAHATQLTVFIGDLLKEADLKIAQLDAITVSKGPGSYTGLRIGVSAAKGLCYAADKPLISVSSLDSMAYGIKSHTQTMLGTNSIDLICPMIDARRMEVYTALYDNKIKQFSPIEALVVTEESFKKQLDQHKILFFGNGAAKCKPVIDHQNAFFIDDFTPSAQFMIPLALEYFSNKNFEDVAYFEPYYLKDFVATVSSKNIFTGLK
jgi:tRNA threonylcarbamoyladenosine biosynthesis protein TsaB